MGLDLQEPTQSTTPLHCTGADTGGRPLGRGTDQPMDGLMQLVEVNRLLFLGSLFQRSDHRGAMVAEMEALRGVPLTETDLAPLL